MHKSEKRNNNKIPPKKLIKRTLVILLILTAIIILVLTNPRFQAYMRLERINKPDAMDEAMPVPEYLSVVVTKYDGELTPQIIAKTYYNFANTIVPKYYKKCKNMSDEKIDSYFKWHKKLIHMELGYTNSEDFKSFIKLIQNLKGEKLEFEDYRIMSETVGRKDGVINGYLVIKYKNNEEIIINTKLLKNLQKKQTSILYSTQIDKEKIKEAQETEKKQEEELNKNESPFKRGIPLEMLE